MTIKDTTPPLSPEEERLLRQHLPPETQDEAMMCASLSVTIANAIGEWCRANEQFDEEGVVVWEPYVTLNAIAAVVVEAIMTIPRDRKYHIKLMRHFKQSLKRVQGDALMHDTIQ